MEIVGSTALAGRRGRYVPLPSLKGPRPSTVDLGNSSLKRGEFGQHATFTGEFNTRARVYTLDEGHIIIGNGNDGALIDQNFQRISEPCSFTQLGWKETPFELDTPIHPTVLKNTIVGFDGAYRNYYHWLINGLGRSWLNLQTSPARTVLFPDFEVAGDRQGWVRADVLRASLEATFQAEAVRFLAPGAHPVRDLQILWTRPTAPTDITAFPQLYTLFDRIAGSVADAPKRRRRLYLSRLGGYDPLLPDGSTEALFHLLGRYGFESLALETMSFAEQVNAAASAEIIVSPHGAGLTNLVFSPRSCFIIELASNVNGEDLPRPWFCQLAGARGQRYGALNTAHPGWLDDLQTTLKRFRA